MATTEAPQDPHEVVLLAASVDPGFGAEPFDSVWGVEVDGRQLLLVQGSLTIDVHVGGCGSVVHLPVLARTVTTRREDLPT